MPASVQDLLLANQAQSSPFISLAQGLAQGFGQGMQNAPDRMSKIVQLQNEIAANKRAAAMDTFLKNKLAGTTEADTSAGFSGVQNPGTAPEGGSRLDQLLGLGHYSESDIINGDFKDMTPAPSGATTSASRALQLSAQPASAGSTVSSGAPNTPYTPGMMLSKIGVGPTGHLVPEFTDPMAKPKTLQPLDYQGNDGRTRIGNYDPNTGKRYMSQDDPLAPKKPADAAQQLREDNFVQKQYQGIVDKYNPDVATSRTAVGILGRANVNGMRIMQIAGDPNTKLTNEDLSALIHDQAQIYAGGAATTTGLDQMKYTSLQQSAAQLAQYLTGNPQDAVPPNIRQHVLDMTRKMVVGNAAQIRQTLDRAESANGNILNDPRVADNWKSFRQQWENPPIPADPNAMPPMKPGDQRRFQTPTGKTFIIKAQ